MKIEVSTFPARFCPEQPRRLPNIRTQFSSRGTGDWVLELLLTAFFFVLQADSNMNDLISEYQQYEDIGPDDYSGDLGDSTEEYPEFTEDVAAI